MDLHVFPIPIPTPASLPIPSLWVFPVHQPGAFVSCIQPGLVICFTLDSILVSVLFSHNIPPSPSPTESQSLFCTSVSFSVLHIWLSLHMSLVIVLTLSNVSCIFPMLFSSLQSIFTIIILNSLSGRLLISSSFIWFLSFYLVPSFVLYFCLFIIFSNLLHLRSVFRVVFLLPFGFCPWRERLVEWFVLISF